MRTDLDALRQQVLQLQQLHEAGALDTPTHEAARQALEQRIVDAVLHGARSAPAAPPAMQPAPAAAPAGRRLSRGMAAGLVAGVVAVAAAGYAWTGSPGLAMRPAAAGLDATASAPHALGTDQIAAMVDGLAQRLQDRPDDAEGWAMLARSYAVTGRHTDAVPAYRRALALRPRDATLLADFADALAVANGRDIAGEPLALVTQALQIDPDHLKALSLAGTAAFDRRDDAAAIAYWERIAAVAPAGSPYLQQVQANLAEARQRGGVAAAPAKPGAPDAAASAAAVSGTVSLAKALQAQAAPDDTVFVFARAAEGPRMPLAIVRRQVKDLPFDFRLDDSSAMSPAARLSSQRSVVVGARISKSGNAAPQPGDLTGQTGPVALGTGTLAVEIAQVVGR